jgi:SAM-dependent methyltransferase
MNHCRQPTAETVPVADGSPNHAFVLACARRMAPEPAARFMDFGCGNGQLVALGRARGLDMVGADSFSDIYAPLIDTIAPDLQPHIFSYRQSLPFAEASFDVVTANMVFEHVPDLPPMLAELARVTKPGGRLLAIFPVAETWYEGHAGLYGVHWLRHQPRLQTAYLSTMHRLGRGLYRDHRSSREWADWTAAVLHGNCCYHRRAEALAAITTAFGAAPHSLADEYMAFRIERSPLQSVLGRVPSAMRKPLLRAVCAVRAGLVLSVQKAGA